MFLPYHFLSQCQILSQLVQIIVFRLPFFPHYFNIPHFRPQFHVQLLLNLLLLPISYFPLTIFIKLTIFINTILLLVQRVLKILPAFADLLLQILKDLLIKPFLIHHCLLRLQILHTFQYIFFIFFLHKLFGLYVLFIELLLIEPTFTHLLYLLLFFLLFIITIFLSLLIIQILNIIFNLLLTSLLQFRCPIIFRLLHLVLFHIYEPCFSKSFLMSTETEQLSVFISPCHIQRCTFPSRNLYQLFLFLLFLPSLFFLLLQFDLFLQLLITINLIILTFSFTFVTTIIIIIYTIFPSFLNNKLNLFTPLNNIEYFPFTKHL